MTAAIILAAGTSSRLGWPKQLVLLAGETLIERAVRTTHEAGCSLTVVVLGANSAAILDNTSLGVAIPVINDAWSEGMSSSIRLGIDSIQSIAPLASGAILMTCDQPSVTPPHLGALIAEGESTSRITASAYAGRHGVPAYFPASAFAGLMQLKGDAGARSLLRNASAINLPHGDLDIDTPADLAQAQKLFGSRR
jgi:CTP:molybdopterin cytidylyltransferase MocA